MDKLKFDDGVVIDISGEDRKIKLRDGWYVVGGGCCIPCVDEEEADKLLSDLEDHSGDNEWKYCKH